LLFQRSIAEEGIVMWRVYLLRAYMFGVGMVLLLLGISKLASSFPMAPIGFGLLCVSAAAALKELRALRLLVGVMGGMLLLGTGTIFAALSFYENSLHFSSVVAFGLIAGAVSLLIVVSVRSAATPSRTWADRGNPPPKEGTSS
jgi:hypothetical protein